MEAVNSGSARKKQDKPMSDIFPSLRGDSFLSQNQQTQSEELSNNGGTKTGQSFLTENQQIQSTLARPRIELQEAVSDMGFSLDDQTANAILQGIMDGLFQDEEQINRYIAAEMVAARYGINAQEAAENMDFYLQDYYKFVPPEERKGPWNMERVVKNLGHSFAQGHIGLRLNAMYSDLEQAELDGDEERAASLRRDIENLKTRSETYWKVEEGPDNPLGRLLYNIGTLTAGNVEFMASIALAGAVAGPTGSFTMGAALVKGNMYNTLREHGATPLNASRGSLVGSFIVSYLESSLGNIPVINNLTGGKQTMLGQAMGNFGERILARVTLKGGFNLLLRGGARVAGVMVNEGAEEFFQSLSETLIQEVVADIQNSMTPEQQMQRPNWNEEVKGAVDDFIKGMEGSVIFGGVNLLGSVRGDRQELYRMREDAKTMDRIPFGEKYADSEVLAGNAEQRRIKLDEIYDSVSRQREREQAALEEEAKQAGGLGTGFEELERERDKEGKPTGDYIQTPEYRNSRGELAIQDDRNVRTGTGTYKAGDASQETKTNLYGYIDYAVDGDTVRIKNMEVVPHRQALTDEFFQRFSKDFADYDIQWEAETDAQIELRDRLVENNGRGAEAGLNYFEKKSGVSLDDQRTAQNIARQFREQDPRTSPEQMGLINNLVRSLGTAVRGTQTAEEGWRALGFDPRNIFTEKITQGNAADYYTNHQSTWGRNGITRELVNEVRAGRAQFSADQIDFVKKNIGGFLTTLKETGNKVIYLAKNNGNFSTVTHEVFHAVRQVLPEDMLRQAEEALGVQEGGWTTAQEEAFARQAEGYLFRGETPDARLKPVMDRIAQIMRDIYQSLKSLIARENPKLDAVFQELLRHMDENTEISGDQTAAKTPQNAREGAAIASEERLPDRDTAGTDLTQYPGLGGRVDTGPVQAEGYDDIEAWVKTLSQEEQKRYAENKALNENRESLKKNDRKVKGWTDPNLVIDGVGAEDLEGVKAAARTAYPKIREIARKWADTYGGEVKGRPVPKGTDPDTPMIKGDKRAIEKHEKERTPYNQMLDMVGFTVVVEDMATLLKMAKEVIPEGAVVRAKDRYFDLMPGGYRDFLLNIRTEGGFVGEIQLNVRQMFEAKETFGGHALYEVTREFDTEIDKGNITKERADKDRDILLEISDRFYGKAYGLTLAGSEANASSLDMTSPSLIVIKTLNGEEDSVLSSFTANNLDRLLAQGWSRHQINRNDESSIDGTDPEDTSPETPGREPSNLSGGAGDIAPESFTSVPSTTNIGQNQQNVNTPAEKNVDISGVQAIRERYQAAKRTDGWEDTKNVGGREIEGRWVLVEAETPTASHDEITFNETEGFPQNNGKSVNDRDYRNDRAAQEAVVKMAGDYDGRALEGIVVSDDGVVISGNNRTMSGKLAARQDTDGNYISALEKKARKYGFTAEQVREYAHPRLVFETEVGGEYSTDQFARFNQVTRKAQSPLETAIKMVKRLAEKTDVTRKIAGIINEHETISELYSDKKAAQDIFNTLRSNGLIGEYELPQYMTEAGAVTGAGEDLLESVMLGAVLTEDNIRGLEESKELRRKLVRGITPLMENSGMEAYSLTDEVNEAVRMVIEVKRGNTFGTVEDYANQPNLDGTTARKAAAQIAHALESGAQRDFFDWMNGLNTLLSQAAAGQTDMFSSGVETKEEILTRYVNLIEVRQQARKENTKILKDPAAGS
jgi:hypothetical protein